MKNEADGSIAITCQCLKPSQEGVPCPHQIAVCNKLMGFRGQDRDWIVGLINPRWLLNAKMVEKASYEKASLESVFSSEHNKVFAE